MSITNVKSTPPYIESFLQANSKQLFEIYDQGMKEHNNVGCLGLKCSEKENKMDVFFMNEESLLQTLKQDSWDSLKESIQGRKLFMIQDLDLNSIFLVYL